MHGYQLVPFPLATATYAASSRSSVDVTTIPADVNGRPAAVAKIDFIVSATPTLNSGTATATELQAAISKITLRDGVRTLFDDRAAVLRLQEALERGVLAPEPDAAATTEAVNFKRTWHAGPPHAARQSDFFIPPGAFKGGSLSFEWGALTDVDAQCTALTLTVTPIVWLAVRDDVVIPPTLERRGFTVASDLGFGGEGLYPFLALLDSATGLAAITAADLTNVQVRGAKVDSVAIHLADLERCYHEDMGVGPFSQVHGEPRAATDDNPKVDNGTAIAAAAALMSPVLWAPRGFKISKIAAEVRQGGNLSVKWSGSAASAYALATRIAPRSEQDAGRYIAMAEKALNARLTAPKGLVQAIDTISKEPYKGPRAAFMPLKLKAV